MCGPTTELHFELTILKNIQKGWTIPGSYFFVKERINHYFLDRVNPFTSSSFGEKKVKRNQPVKNVIQKESQNFVWQGKMHVYARLKCMFILFLQ